MFDPVLAHVEKSSLSKALKAAATDALKSLSALKGDMPEGAWKDLQKALKACLAGGPEDDQMMSDAKKSQADAEAQAAEAKAKSSALVATIEKSFALATEGRFDDVKAELAKASGKEVAVKSAIPDEMRAQWEALQKSQADALAKLEQMQKSVAAERAENARREWTAKSATLYPLVPGTPERTGALLADAYAKSEKDGKELEAMFAATQEQLAKSQLFTEVGSGGHGSQGSTAAKAEKMAKELMRKSAKPMTQAQALRQVYSDPEIYAAFEAERTQG